VDGCSVEDFEADLKDNLYRVWNRMSSGSYFPPPVLAVEIPKPHGSGTRMLGVPTIADRVAQTVVARRLEARVEQIFHHSSYGYRPGRSALDAVAACRQRCWKTDWVVDLDIQKFFDSVPWDLIVKAVEVNTDQPWVILYVRRWLAAGREEPHQPAPAAPIPDQRRFLVTQPPQLSVQTRHQRRQRRHRNQPPITAAGTTPTPDQILGALCAALDPRNHPHQAERTDAAHNPALFIRVGGFAGVGQPVHALRVRRVDGPAVPGGRVRTVRR
jgi:hypothetical protein